MWGDGGNDIIYGGAGNDNMYGTSGSDYLSDTTGGADQFNLYYDIFAGSTDYMVGITVGTDYVILPSHLNGNVSFFQSGADAYGSISVAGGTYQFGAAGLTVAQLQAAIYYY